jgi:hypothetical protein
MVSQQAAAACLTQDFLRVPEVKDAIEQAQCFYTVVSLLYNVLGLL